MAEYADHVGGEFVVCGPEVSANGQVLRRKPNGGQSPVELGDNCAGHGSNSVLSPVIGRGALSTTSSNEQQVAGSFVALTVRDRPTVTGCDEFDRVIRVRLFREVVVSRAWRCPLVLPPYQGAIRFDGSGEGAPFLLGGWRASGGEAFVEASSPASVGFVLPDAAAAHAIEISVTDAGAASFRLNNRVVDAEQIKRGWRIPIPNELAGPGAEGNVVLTVRPVGDSVGLEGLEVVPSAG